MDVQQFIEKQEAHSEKSQTVQMTDSVRKFGIVLEKEIKRTIPFKFPFKKKNSRVNLPRKHPNTP